MTALVLFQTRPDTSTSNRSCPSDLLSTAFFYEPVRRLPKAPERFELTVDDIMRVLLDTNIILIGGLAPDSIAAKLSRLRHDVQFLVTESILSECANVIGKSGRDAEHIMAANAMVTSYVRDIGALTVPSTTKHSSVHHDAHVTEAANELEVQGILTYNVRDMNAAHAPSYPPAVLLRMIHPKEHLVEVPLPWKTEGTLIFGFRQYPVSSLGDVLADGVGNVLCERGDRKLRLEGSSVLEQQASGELPYGYATDLWVRMRTQGDQTRIEAKAWFGRAEGAVPAGSPIPLFEGVFESTPPVEVRLAFGENHGFVGEIFYASGIPVALRQGAVVKGIVIGTLEGSWGSEDIGDLMDRIKVEGRHGIMTVRPARSRRRIRWPRFPSR